MLAGVLALSGCGGDDEEPSTTPTRTAETETETTASVPTETEQEPPAETQPPEPPEQEEEDGAADEEFARTLALFTARGGRITPRVVRVPAFISVQVELRSPDGDPYRLRFGGSTMSVGGKVNSVALSFDGLRPGEALVGRPIGAGNPVRIEATAEPGP